MAPVVYPYDPADGAIVMPDASLDKPPLPTRLADYRPPDFLIDQVALEFDLGDAETLVKSHLQLRRNPDAAAPAAPLRLDGEELELVAISLDGKPLAPGDYALEPDGALVVPQVPDAFALDIAAHIHPERNTQLSGLYTSGGNYCTQCEPEGFRRITYFLDRPDVMSRFTVTIRADKSRFPVLLSNGNPSGSGDLPDGRHFAKWIDPHPKPSYLFALVAGDLVAVRDQFTTRSGRNVALAICRMVVTLRNGSIRTPSRPTSSRSSPAIASRCATNSPRAPAVMWRSRFGCGAATRTNAATRWSR